MSCLESAAQQLSGTVCVKWRVGWNTWQPRLVAVSKTKPVEHIMEAYEAGQRHFGENYVAELVEKADKMPSDMQWHFIGHLQSNKARLLVDGVPSLWAVESVDSRKLANKLNNAWGRKEKEYPLRIFIQVNTTGEPQKGGVEPEDVIGMVRHVKEECEHLHFAGLMTIGKLGETSAEYFKLLRDVRSSVCRGLGIDASEIELSMGMSNDFEMAIEYGSTNVRLGSTIFGARDYAQSKKSGSDEPGGDREHGKVGAASGGGAGASDSDKE